MLLPVTIARDRYTAYRKALRFSANGGLVICDRFPLPQLTLMDSPRIERRLEAGTGNRLGERLSRIERGYYRRLARPDVLIVLRVDPETAVERKPEEEPDFVRARWAEIWNVNWEASGAHIVDASRPPGEVLSEVKSLVWSEV
jgi:thymidylate kinase